MHNSKYSFLVVTLMVITCSCMASMPYPGRPGGQARSSHLENHVVLENDLLKIGWSVKGGGLGPSFIENKVFGTRFSQAGRELFRIRTAPIAPESTEWTYLGLRMRDGICEVTCSLDGTRWNVLQTVTPPKGMPSIVRYGKLDSMGRAKSHSDLGAWGICRIKLPTCPKAPKFLNLPKSVYSKKNHMLTLATKAHSGSALEHPWQSQVMMVSCGVSKGSDRGMTWGPGLAIVWKDGGSVKVCMREVTTIQVDVNGKETFHKRPKFMPAFDLKSSDFSTKGKARLRTIKGNPKAARLADRHDAKVIEATLVHSRTGLEVIWTARLTDDANSIRQNLVFNSKRTINVTALALLDLSLPTPKQIGRVPGSPVTAGGLFFGAELPVGQNEVSLDSSTTWFPCRLTISPTTPYEFSTVIGSYPKGQLRRAFLYYVERERAHPYHQLLHYNCWYDLGFGLNEKALSEVIDAFDKHMIQRGVPVKSFVLDDGWDDVRKGLWAINDRKFPKGFAPIAKKLKAVNSNLGIWISPLGGYGGCKERTELARKMGLITGETLDLSEPGYYRWYRDTCLKMMKDLSVNYFKWDKAGSGVSPHFMSLLDVGKALRKQDPKIFLNVTVGTWPSPFWLKHVDCTWRHGADVGWIGKGDDREKWMTFRDMECYRRVVKAAPLYPLNSIMHHGLVHGRHFQGKRVSQAGTNLKNEARSYFGTGANLQELYLTPSMMTESGWAQVREAAKWAAKNADVLVDTHWVGGDPGKLEPYGYASWRPGKGTLMVRNPNQVEQTISLDPKVVFELPANVSANFELNSPYTDQRVKKLILRGKRNLTLKPFEVLVFDAKPIER